jgi:hypothetical protein
MQEIRNQLLKFDKKVENSEFKLFKTDLTYFAKKEDLLINQPKLESESTQKNENFHHIKELSGSLQSTNRDKNKLNKIEENNPYEENSIIIDEKNQNLKNPLQKNPIQIVRIPSALKPILSKQKPKTANINVSNISQKMDDSVQLGKSSSMPIMSSVPFFKSMKNFYKHPKMINSNSEIPFDKTHFSNFSSIANKSTRVPSRVTSRFSDFRNQNSISNNTRSEFFFQPNNSGTNFYKTNYLQNFRSDAWDNPFACFLEESTLQARSLSREIIREHGERVHHSKKNQMMMNAVDPRLHMIMKEVLRKDLVKEIDQKKQENIEETLKININKRSKRNKFDTWVTKIRDDVCYRNSVNVVKEFDLDLRPDDMLYYLKEKINKVDNRFIKAEKNQLKMIKMTNNLRKAKDQAEIKINKAIDKTVKFEQQSEKKIKNKSTDTIDKSDEIKIGQNDLLEKTE